MDQANALFEPMRVGNATLRNRVAMAPMTRQRSHLDGTPTELNVEYYRQRAGAGLIISEGIYPSEMGKGYLFTPGLCTDAHVEGWARVADAVHAEGGAIFAQIMHVGRLSDQLLLPGGAQPIAPSAVRPDPLARQYTVSCPRPKRSYLEPRALSRSEIYEVIDDYKRSAEYALKAGFDGVEIHGASGYLPMQFLSTNTNLRTDDFGGSVEGRANFILSCVDAMCEVAGPSFVAVKIGPGWTFHNVFDDDPALTFSYVAKALSKRQIAFLEVGDYGMDWDVYGTIRPLFDGPMIAVAGFTRASANAAIAANRADMVAFGKAFISNPDLAERYQNGWPIARPIGDTFYTQGELGYTDYAAFDACDPETLAPVDSALQLV
jgi:N-ethylmaleimide reductase